jgi:hypothetical protein
MNENDLERFAIKKLHITIPAVIFDRLCKARMMNDIDELVTRLLINELNDGDLNGRNIRK